MTAEQAPAVSDQHARYLRQQLRLIQSGRISRAPGIRKCPDCHEHYIADDTPMPWCPDCRVNHSVTCRDCRTPFPCDREGSTLCRSCRAQTALF